MKNSELKLQINEVNEKIKMEKQKAVNTFELNPLIAVYEKEKVRLISLCNHENDNGGPRPKQGESCPYCGTKL